MDGIAAPEIVVPLVRTAHTARLDAPSAVADLTERLGEGPFSLVSLFVSPQADIQAISDATKSAFPGAAIIGCTTAGEISSDGYVEGEIVAMALPASHFSAYLTVIDDLKSLDQQQIASDLMSARAEQTAEHPAWTYEFAFMLIDGMSQREDQLAAAISAGLGPVPQFGGSAGDGVRFERTYIMAGGKVRENASVVAMVRTVCPIRTFKFDNLTPTDRKMVVTQADPERRTVREINAEPAAREYARLLGKDPEQLSPLIFAAHPVLVQIGGQHHVRSIQSVAENGDLNFFSAIDEGVVLTLAEPEDIAAHLDRSLSGLSTVQEPAAILACDCILRKTEAEQKQAAAAVSRILAKRKVTGFNTYGEQWNGAHVNQTLTGVAIYPPEAT